VSSFRAIDGSKGMFTFDDWGSVSYVNSGFSSYLDKIEVDQLFMFEKLLLASRRHLMFVECQL